MLSQRVVAEGGEAALETPPSLAATMDAVSRRRLGVLSGHVAAEVASAPPEALLVRAPTSTSVGVEFAQPRGYSVALPERLGRDATGDFNVYRCAHRSSAR